MLFSRYKENLWQKNMERGKEEKEELIKNDLENNSTATTLPKKKQLKRESKRVKWLEKER